MGMDGYMAGGDHRVGGYFDLLVSNNKLSRLLTRRVRNRYRGVKTYGLKLDETGLELVLCYGSIKIAAYQYSETALKLWKYIVIAIVFCRMATQDRDQFFVKPVLYKWLG